MKCFHFIRKRFLRRRHVPNYVLGEIADVNGAQPEFTMSDEHQRVVIGQVDVDVVGLVIGPFQASSIRLPPMLSVRLSWEDFLGAGSPCRCRVQELSRLLMPDATTFLPNSDDAPP